MTWQMTPGLTDEQRKQMQDLETRSSNDRHELSLWWSAFETLIQSRPGLGLEEVARAADDAMLQYARRAKASQNRRIGYQAEAEAIIEAAAAGSKEERLARKNDRH